MKQREAAKAVPISVPTNSDKSTHSSNLGDESDDRADGFEERDDQNEKGLKFSRSELCNFLMKCEYDHRGPTITTKRYVFLAECIELTLDGEKNEKYFKSIKTSEVECNSGTVPGSQGLLFFAQKRAHSVGVRLHILNSPDVRNLQPVSIENN
ncbi:hypothetical protein QAD02_003518 [Eretmocerus hayati]|uniref:Uncharacterized protein n=1 Tax=Eretmocerus hayati TaxID=131215 RepID=A0ACC2NPM2_9HYME|nr:hypothetical protein QAD02_003518 [Eretmocerus hayati]